MEIEAKFALPDVETFQRLEVADQLAGFALGPGQVKEMHDTYLDTPDRLIIASGYACRRREQGDEGTLITLKGLQSGAGVVRRREELEVLLPAGSSHEAPALWPAGPLRDKVLQAIGDSSLMLLFDLNQTRLTRPMSWDEREVAELCLDNVHLAADDGEQVYRVLEVELLPEGTEDDLAAIVKCLQDEWELQPEPWSKFERGLAFSTGTAVDSLLLPGKLLAPAERAVCFQIAARNDAYSRRALALLALDEGRPQAEAGEQAGLSARRVRYWLKMFREKRLEIFPAGILAQAQTGSELAPAEPEAPQVVPPIELAGEDSRLTPPPVEGLDEAPQPLPLETLLERYEVDMVHARAVAGHALALFDGLLPFHNLPPERRPLLETAALVHNIGLETDPECHHSARRDILLAHPPAELSERERRMVVLTTFLHRKRITPKKLDKLAQSPLADLPEPVWAEMLALAALVRLADGLDYSQTASTRLGAIQARGSVVEIEVEGPEAALDAERAQTKSDLWELLFDTELRFKLVGREIEKEIETEMESVESRAEAVEEAAQPAAVLPDAPGLVADDSMAEAARKTFYFHFQRMLYHEPGTRLGQDIEELHDMRVATRRMRAAFWVFGDYLDLEQMRPHLKGLRRTGRALGPVRDLDVMQEKTDVYLSTLPPERQDDLEPLLAVWSAEYSEARELMLAYMDGRRYSRFKERFGEFLQTPGAGARPILSPEGEPLPHRLCHVAPVALYQRLAAVRAYDEWVTGPHVPLERLHQLRIAAKGLRYTLEFFQEVLEPGSTKTLIKEIKDLQDHLGDLQDAVVASDLLRDFLTYGTWGQATPGERQPTTVIAPGVVAYMAFRQAELQRLIETFPSAWARIQGLEFSRLMAQAVAGL